MDGARCHCTVVCQVIRRHHPPVLLQHIHYRRSYPALVEPCTAAILTPQDNVNRLQNTVHACAKYNRDVLARQAPHRQAVLQTFTWFMPVPSLIKQTFYSRNKEPKIQMSNQGIKSCMHQHLGHGFAGHVGQYNHLVHACAKPSKCTFRSRTQPSQHRRQS